MAPKKRSTKLQFPTTGFEIIKNPVTLEEECLGEFRTDNYHPVKIGHYVGVHHVLGKLGFDATSTVWLAQRQMSEGCAILKVYTRKNSTPQQYQIMSTIDNATSSHPGAGHVRKPTFQGLFVLHDPAEGDNHCLAQKPMVESWKDVLRRTLNGRFAEADFKIGLRQLLLALDYLHTECRLIHTEINPDNILNDTLDNCMLEEFVKAELASPSARKIINSQITIYASRPLESPHRFGNSVLDNFNAAVQGDVQRNHDAQSTIYRCPEVMLGVDWSYPTDIWNVGVMIWEIFQGKSLFDGSDPDTREYSARAHLAEIIALLGPPPLDLLARGQRSHEFFAEHGKWIANVEIPEDKNFVGHERFLEGDNKAGFMNLVRGMLQWRPEDRKTARELAQDPWLNA